MKHLLFTVIAVCTLQFGAYATNPTIEIINNSGCDIWVTIYARQNVMPVNCVQYVSSVVYHFSPGANVTFDMFTGGPNTPVNWVMTPAAGSIWARADYTDYDPAGGCSPTAGSGSCGPYDANSFGCGFGNTKINVSSSVSSCIASSCTVGACITATGSGVAPNGILTFN